MRASDSGTKNGRYRHCGTDWKTKWLTAALGDGRMKVAGFEEQSELQKLAPKFGAGHLTKSGVLL